MPSRTDSSPAPIAAVDLDADAIPYARTLLALPLSELAVMQRTIEVMFRTAHSRAYTERVDRDAGFDHDRL